MFSLLSLLSLTNVLTGVQPPLAVTELTAVAPAPVVAQTAEQEAAQTVAQMSPQVVAQAGGEVITVPQDVRSLPGGLDNIPVFNSNSPEIISNDGILLSTFPPRGKSDPSAHLNYTFNGRFDVFSHHVARGQDDRDTRTVYESILVHNPGRRAVTLTVREGASHISQESPWNEIASGSSNLYSNNFSGPGSRVMNDILRDRRQASLPSQITIAPGESQLLLNAPIPLRRLSVATDGTLPPGSVISPPPDNCQLW